MANHTISFLTDETGTVSVDWTVLSAATVAMSLATVGVLNGGIQGMVSRMDGELREQQMSDNFIEFTSAHFEPLYEGGYISAETAETFFDIANGMLNQELIDALEYGITALEEGQLSTEDLAALVAVASVAYQRNLIDDQIMHYYFGFDGSDGRYAQGL